MAPSESHPIRTNGGVVTYKQISRQHPNSDIKPPLPVVDPERFYRSGEK
jgi:hypothetical protein